MGIDVGSTVPAELGLIQAKSLRIRGIVGLGGHLAAGDPVPGRRDRGPHPDRDRTLPAGARAAGAQGGDPESGNIKVHIEVAP